jgi:ferric-dicitrate binding protein FerR (iron transport regulator)
MSATLVTPDAEQFRAFSNGSEDALAAIYGSQYDGLVTIARQQLGDELSHHAPRIAQQAMLDAWESRAKFDNPTGLSAYLEQAVVECVAVQRRKHASLHRRGGAPKRTGPTPTKDEAVAQLIGFLHAPPKSHEELIEEARATKKHHAAEHVQAVANGRSWKGPAALIGTLVLVAAAGLWYMDSRSEDIAIDKALKSEDARSLSTSPGQRGPVTLNDDSRVRMGSDTRFKMPRDFGGTMRTLEMTGVAHFEVAPGKTLPFRVRAHNAVITATGTAFTVRAYEGDSTVLVSVAEGQVDVTLRDGDAKSTVTAGNAVRVRGETIDAVDAAARDLALSWLRDTLVFVDAPVKEVIPELQRWYGLNPKLDHDSLGERRVSLRIALQSSGDAIKALADSAKLHIGFDKDEKVVLSAKPDAPPGKK